MKCSILGCEHPARGQVDAIDVQWRARVVTVPAHLCKFCKVHECEMEVFLLRRARR